MVILSTHPNSDKVESRTSSPNVADEEKSQLHAGFTKLHTVLKKVDSSFVEQDRVNVIWLNKSLSNVIGETSLEENCIDDTQIQKLARLSLAEFLGPR